jgi:hypothetical protein
MKIFRRIPESIAYLAGTSESRYKIGYGANRVLRVLLLSYGPIGGGIDHDAVLSGAPLAGKHRASFARRDKPRRLA